MKVSDDALAELATETERLENKARALLLTGLADQLHAITRELDNALGDSLVRQYRGRFGERAQ